MSVRSFFHLSHAAPVSLLLIALAGPWAVAPGSQADRDLEGLLDAGERYYKARRYHEALQAFETALGLSDKEAEPRIRRYLAAVLAALGLEYASAGESRLAEETFQRALKYGEDYYARLGLGYLYFLRLDDADALDELKAALKLEHTVKRRQDLARVPKLLALLEYRQGRLSSAIPRLKEATRLDPKDREAVTLLGRWQVEASISATFEEQPTKQFLFRVDRDVDPVLRDRFIGEMIRAYAEVGETLGLWPERQVPVVLYSVENFHRATGAYHWVGGMYDGQLKIPAPAEALTDAKALESLRRAIQHEYAHVLIRRMAPECPVWLNEGIAQHFEHKATRQAVERLLYRERSQRLPLERIPARLWEVDDEELARQSYLQGLGFVEFLVDRFHGFRLRLLLLAIAEEHSVGRAFKRVYGATLESLEKEWWSGIEEREGRNDQ